LAKWPSQGLVVLHAMSTPRIEAMFMACNIPL
jgi:hypothetical protein